MPKTVPEPDAVSKPFWDAVDQKKLMLQYCTNCSKLQYPIRPNCIECGKTDSLTWREVQGKGHILETMVVHDTRVVRRKVDVPFNVALVSLDEDPGHQLPLEPPGHARPPGAAGCAGGARSSNRSRAWRVASSTSGGSSSSDPRRLAADHYTHSHEAQRTEVTT